MSDTPLLLAKHLKKQYTRHDGFVLDDVAFSVQEGDIVALLGESGSGKTTLLRLIAGFEELQGGEISISGACVAKKGWSLPPEVRAVGMVFQDYALFPHMTVAGNIGFGLGKHAQGRIAEVLALVGLPDLGHRYPHELSGGQQQRIALARALAPSPRLLLLDEPFSNLDESLKAQVRQDLKAILKQTGTTAVFVTHDTQDALATADRIVVLRNGRVAQEGTPEWLYAKPNSTYVAEYFGPVNWIEATAQQGLVHTPWGQLPCKQLDGPCLLGLRPHHITLTDTPAQQNPLLSGIGRADQIVFQGNSWEIRSLEAPPLAIWANTLTPPNLGEPIYWEALPERAILLPKP